MAKLFDHIPLMRPWLGVEETEAVAEVIRSGWVSSGPRVAQFEDAVARYVGARHAVAVNSCTSALHLALRLSGVGPGDEVVLPSWTCMATANAVHLAGAEPAFADIDPRTYNLNPAAAAEAVSPRTRAILLVHQIGQPADVSPFQALAERHGLVLIEDGACALGAEIDGRRVGGLGAPTTFSFHPRKMITTGEGGMLTTDDAAMAEGAARLRSHGASISDMERHRARGMLVQQYPEPGCSYRMTDIQAAIGLVQLAKLSAILEQRAAQARRYDESLARLEELEAPYVPPSARHAYSSYLIRLRPGARPGRDALLRELAERGISCRAGIPPLHHEPFYRGRFGRLDLPETEAAARTTLFLPIFPGLTEAQQALIIAALEEVLTQHR
jgi:dTDP-4-amino-4,6-dideoxygalactose transaminase